MAIIPFAQASMKVKKHFIAYKSYTEDEVRIIAKHFDLVGVLYPHLAKKIKGLNPDVTILIYENAMAMHKEYADWIKVNTHEDWFIYSRLGHRLKRDKWCWYLMDPASGWGQYLVERTGMKLAAFSSLDGVFVDDCWPRLYDFKFHADIENELCSVNADGHTITVLYNIWNGPARSALCEKQVGVHGVYTNTEQIGRDYSQGSTCRGRTIKLETRLPPGTPLYVNYAAKDQEIFKPDPGKVRSFPDDVSAMLRRLKTTLSDDKIVIGNTGSSTAYLDIIDGVMLEGFVSGTRTGDYDYPSFMQWKADLNKQQKAVAEDRTFLAHSGTSGTSEDGKAIRKKAVFCYVSHLLVFDPAHSFFGFAARGTPVTWYPEWEVQLGKPDGSYYLLDQGNPGKNLVSNGSFERGLKGWTVVKESISRTPAVSETESFNGAKSAHFVDTQGEGCSIRGALIPVQGNSKYRLSARVKGSNITPGPSWWRKLGVWGWWYDKQRNRLSQFSLLFPKRKGKGTFDWVYLTHFQDSPAEARYFQIHRLGLAKNARGEGWIDDVRLIKDESSHEYIVFARDFSNGLVLVNMGTGYHTVTLSHPYYTFRGKRVHNVKLDAHQAAILLKETPRPAS